MARKRRQFYVPRTDMWRWSALTDTYLKVERDRVRASYDETENALAVLDRSVDELQRLVFEEYRKGTPRLKESVEIAYAEINDERKRILKVQERIVQELSRIKAELSNRKLDTDRAMARRRV